MNEDYYLTHYQHGLLTACFPVNLKKIAFIFKDQPHEEDDRELHQFPTRILAYLAEKNPKGRLGTIKWKQGITTAYICATQENNWVVCTDTFNINEIIHQTEWYDTPNNERGRLAKGIVNIDNDIYTYGMVRNVFKRIGIKKWKNITTETKHPNLYTDVNANEETFIGDGVGFSALDGFNSNDIYAGGNKGDCWHYNGKIWQRKDLPLNHDISSITCTPDGFVYISCRLGPMIVGRDEKWETITKSQEITHCTWFKGKTYFTDIHGRIYTHEKDTRKLVEATFKTQYPEYMHHNMIGISSCDECLVVYTSIQAYAYDGETWHEIIEIPSLSKNK